MHDFVHLHVHSEYSLLDGYAATNAIVARAVELGMDSIALTDHGVMYGAVEFYTNAKKAGVKPIIGLEAYMAPGSRQDATSRGAKHSYHLLLLAKDETGYRNLVRLTTRAHLDGMGKGVFARPRIDRALLEQHHEGLIVTSACIAGEVVQRLKEQQKAQAREIAAYYRDLLGPDNYFLELQLHDNIPELEAINDELARIGKELGIPLAVTNDAHFVRPEDVEAHTMILALGYTMTLKELCAKGRAMDSTYHIMTGEEMWRRFKKYGTAPLENTRRIAERCNLTLEFGRVQLPTIDIPEGYDASSYLRFVCEEGLMRRFNGHPPEAYVKRLDYELDVINQTGFPDYMLIVWDYVKFARARGIPCLPRGSAGASLILYCLGVTDVDPVKNNLLFERFLSPERLEMPDIDIDFADSRRHEVLDYIAERYGRANTAQIITYGTLGAKAAIRDIGRVLEIPLNDVNRIAQLIPAQPAGITIAQALERSPELQRIAETNPALANLIHWAQKVEGRIKSVGTHACGVVVSRTPLEEMVPLQRATKDENALMAAFEGPTLQKMGLLKMDVLGLTNLSVVAEALDYIAQTAGRKMDLSDIPLDDPKVFEALGRGETTNVFQLESPGMTRYLMQLKPTRVEDLYAMVALYRPGPLEQIPVYIHNKNHPQDIAYLHPILKPILEDTYGVIVYQEQIMRLLQDVADYTLGQAYIVIKAISKKDKKLMAENEVTFKQGCLRKGLTQEQADQLWNLILPFAGYSFNRPHATLYGLLSYQTAWLKVNYPVEYMAAVLKGANGATDDIAKAVNECRRRGVPVLGPDINASGRDFAICEVRDPSDGRVKRGIRFGLAAIKHVGVTAIDAILRERDAHGPFRSLEDLCERVDRHALNKRALESLIKCGALDSLPGSRHALLQRLDATIDVGSRLHGQRRAGQASLFDGGAIAVAHASERDDVAIDAAPDDGARRSDVIQWEKELLGVAFSRDPRKRLLEEIHLTDRLPIAQLKDDEAIDALLGCTHVVAGIAARIRVVKAKTGGDMAIVALEDEDNATADLVAFPETWRRYRDAIRQDAVLVAHAQAERRNGVVQLRLVRLIDDVVLVHQDAQAAPRRNGERHGAESAPPPVPAELHAAVPSSTAGDPAANGAGPPAAPRRNGERHGAESSPPVPAELHAAVPSSTAGDPAASGAEASAAPRRNGERHGVESSGRNDEGAPPFHDPCSEIETFHGDDAAPPPPPLEIDILPWVPSMTSSLADQPLASEDGLAARAATPIRAVICGTPPDAAIRRMQAIQAAVESAPDGDHPVLIVIETPHRTWTLRLRRTIAPTAALRAAIGAQCDPGATERDELGRRDDHG